MSNPTTDDSPRGPMAEQFSIGAVFSRGLDIFLRNLVPFWLLALLVNLIALLYQLALPPDPLTGASPAGNLVLAVLQILLSMVVTAALVYGTIQDMRGRQVGIGDIISQGLARMFPVLGVAIVAGLVIGIGFVLLIVPGLIALTILWVAVPAAVVERPGVFGALARSAELTRGYRWQVFGVAIVYFVLQLVASGLIAMLFGTVGALALILQTVGTAFFSAFGAVLVAVSYHALRTVKEGADIDQIAAAFD